MLFIVHQITIDDPKETDSFVERITTLTKINQECLLTPVCTFMLKQGSSSI